MKFKLLFVSVLTSLWILPQSLFGWGLIGHRIIGELAQRHLGVEAQKKLDGLLSHAGVAMVATWGDFVRSDSNYAGTDRWHYRDMPEGLTRQEFDEQVVAQDDGGELICRINSLIDDLAKNPDDTVKLKFLIHFIGDMHQPLHIGHLEDKGGNGVKIRWMGHETNLHALWDDGMIEFQKLSYTEYADYLCNTHPFSVAPFEKSMILDWAWDTYQTTQTVYASVDEVSSMYKYNFTYVSLLESRLVTAAEHLAQVLNYLYNN